MVYSAELLVVMIDRLKIVRIHALVRRVHGHKRLDNDAFLAFLSRSMKAAVSRARCAGRCRVQTQKNRLLTTC